MSDGALTAEAILVAAEDVLRRFGPDKATVVDVARALGVSHGSVYRHFASKAALRDAVAQRWLARVTEPLAAIAAERSAPPRRLRRWFDRLRELKREKALRDPELFATYHALATEIDGVVTAHVAELVGQVARILRDGVARGDFALADVDGTARALLSATQRFHHPLHSAEWSAPDNDTAFEGVWGLLERGLGAREGTVGAR